jgi:hypothetical protein
MSFGRHQRVANAELSGHKRDLVRASRRQASAAQASVRLFAGPAVDFTEGGSKAFVSGLALGDES